MDTAEAGKALLARGKLRNRVTLIPLDKVQRQVNPSFVILHSMPTYVGRSDT